MTREEFFNNIYLLLDYEMEQLMSELECSTEEDKTACQK